MAMANDAPASRWRNFIAWSATGAVFYALAVWGVSSLLHEGGMSAVFRSKEVVAKLGLGLLFATACVGFSSWKRPVSLRAFRNFAVSSVAAVIGCLLILRGFRTLVGTGVLDGMGASEWVAVITGSALIILALLGTFNVAIAYKGGHFMEADIADELRERGRLLLLSFAWIAASGLLLIVLGLAGPGGVLSPAAALAGALALIAVLTLAGIAVWRLSDELGRTLSHEAGNMAFYLIQLLGGGWAMLAHLGFVAAPAPIDWLTLFTVILFVASVIAAGRRRLLTR